MVRVRFAASTCRGDPVRALLHGDVSNAARALLAAAPAARPGLALRMIREAEAADRHVRRTGRLHPRWGNGSLMAAARRRRLADEPGFDDRDYCRCFAMVLVALAWWRDGARSGHRGRAIHVGDFRHHGFAFGKPHPR